MKNIVFLLVLLLTLPIVPLHAQGRAKKVKVTGYIADAAGNPVTDVLIMADNTLINTTVNRKGIFKFRTSPKTESFTVINSQLGSIEKEFTLTDTISFIFEGILQGMPENPIVAGEVIDIGYGSARRDALSTNVSKVDVDNNKRIHYQNIYEMMKGEVPGVQVSGRSIRIQGISSMNLSNEPLFIVNGMATADVSNIPPNEVESISVLKGASASIYGSRGANGVILIKLK